MSFYFFGIQNLTYPIETRCQHGVAGNDWKWQENTPMAEAVKDPDYPNGCCMRPQEKRNVLFACGETIEIDVLQRERVQSEVWHFDTKKNGLKTLIALMRLKNLPAPTVSCNVSVNAVNLPFFRVGGKGNDASDSSNDTYISRCQLL